MTSLRQLEANRRNARKSTGPRTENGKHASRRNALRHGFTAETVLEPLEDLEDYRTFEAAIVSEYLPRTPAEQELAHRLASLFWRLRRATAIETGLLRMQGEILHAFRNSRAKMVQTGEEDAYIPGFATTMFSPQQNATMSLIPTWRQRPGRTQRVMSPSAFCGSQTSTTISWTGSAAMRRLSGASSRRHSLRSTRSDVGKARPLCAFKIRLRFAKRRGGTVRDWRLRLKLVW